MFPDKVDALRNVITAQHIEVLNTKFRKLNFLPLYCACWKEGGAVMLVIIMIN
jgi:hypothetical protein